MDGQPFKCHDIPFISGILLWTGAAIFDDCTVYRFVIQKSLASVNDIRIRLVFAVIGWPTLLISVLGLMPYQWVKPLLTVLTFINPAELVRLFVVIKLGGGSILGPEYYQWVDWLQPSSGSWIFMGICLLWIACSIVAVYGIWERGRSHG